MPPHGTKGHAHLTWPCCTTHALGSKRTARGAMKSKVPTRISDRSRTQARSTVPTLGVLSRGCACLCPLPPFPRKSHCEAYISMPTQCPARLIQESMQRPAVTPAACTCVQPHCLPGPGSGTSRKGQSPQLDVVPKSGPRSGPETGPKGGPQNRSNDSRWTRGVVQNGGRKTVLKNATTDGAERNRRRKPCSAQLRSRSCPDALVCCDHLAL